MAPDSAASHLGLLCLPMSNKKGDMLIWVNNKAVWPTFELLTRFTTRSLYVISIKIFSNLLFRFQGQDFGSGCTSSWSLLTCYYL